MKNTKRQFKMFSFFDFDGITAHMEKMAADGWLIVGVKGNLWKYKKISLECRQGIQTLLQW